MTTERSPINEQDVKTLVRALELESKFKVGIFPRGGAQHLHFNRLERLGVLEFTGIGTDIDGIVERECKIYKLTELGKHLAEFWS